MRMFILLLTLFVLVQPAHAQEPPFILPVAAPPGPGTWLLGQPYGNTAGAFLRGDDWYRAGQRLHFGIDLSMPCGTQLVAIGDGEVVGVSDLSFGSAPHNLLIRHDAGYVSLYGHLLERPQLVPGMRVTQGQPVGLSGDPDLTCRSRPHLHLEIRSLDYRTAYNPVPLIRTDWQSLALIGQFRYPMFQQDLDHARRWLTLDNQPDVAFGGQALNRYAATFPPIESFVAPANPPLSLPIMPLAESYQLRRVTFEGCCANAAWHPTDANRLYVIDGVEGSRALLYEWDVALGGPTGVVMNAPAPLRSPDGSHDITIRQADVVIRRAADGAEWSVPLDGGSVPAISPDNQQMILTRTGAVPLPGESVARTTLTISGLDGSNVRVIADAPGVSAMWLDSTRVLLWQRTEATTALFVHDSQTGATEGLAAYDFLRGLSVGPGGERLLFYLANQPDPTANGLYMLETRPGAQPVRLPWFGAWRWRGPSAVFYIPFSVGSSAGPQQLRHYDFLSGADTALTDPARQPFVVANGDWAASPDGTRVAFWNAADLTTWVIEPAGTP